MATKKHRRIPVKLRGSVASLSFTAHENNGEWVIRVHDGKGGYAGIAAAVGEREADLIVRSLNSVCSNWASSAEPIKRMWEAFVQ